ncbi:MAG: septum formation initiator family protein [Chloroflexota bacterium]
MSKIFTHWKQVLVLIAFVVLFFLLMDLNSRLGDLSRLNNQLVKIETQVAGLKATESALSTQIIYSTSEAAVNEYAREHGLIREGEKLIVPVGESTPQGVVNITPEPTPIPVKNVDVWWALFFGE